jgi:hypothetical protein
MSNSRRQAQQPESPLLSFFALVLMGFARTKVKLKVMLVCFSAVTIKDRTEMNLCVYETHIPKGTAETIVENIRQYILKRVKTFFSLK